jgi:PAS domain S-box-containing protein
MLRTQKMPPVEDDRRPPEGRSLFARLAALVLNPIQSSIGTRLTLSFVVIVLLMAAGYAIAIWEFRQLLIQEQGLDRVQQKSAAVLDLHSHLFAFRDKLEDLADSHNDQQFLRETAEFRKNVLDDIERAKRTFVGEAGQMDSDSFVVVSLEAIETAMPTQIDALADLAEAQDWSGIRFRSQHQIRQLSYLTASLVGRAAAEVTEERTRVTANAERAKRWASISLLGFGGSTLFVAAVLGSLVTRSITRPLAILRQGTQALAKGEFHHQVTTAGEDELADLAYAFNDAARQLQKLYANLEESEARFRSLIEHSSDFIVVLDRDCNIVYVSPSSEQVLKLDPGQLLGKHISAILHADDIDCMLFASAKTAHSGQTFEFRYQHPDGDGRIIEAVKTDLLDDPNVRGIVLNARDISERRRAEAELRRSEAFLNEGQRLSHTGSWALEIATGEMKWSVEHARILGYEGCRPNLERFWARVHPEDQPRVRSIFEQAIAEKSDAETGLRLIMPDGSVRLIHMVCHSVIGKSGEVVEFIGTSVDVTERKRAEDALRQAQAELAHVARVASMGELTASIAHEVSQPLTGIIVNATAGQQWLHAEPPNIPKVRENLGRIIRDGERASEIVARVRAFFKKSPYRADELDINVITQEVIDLMGGELRRKQVVLQTRLADGLAVTLGDRVQLQQVILNLIMNGIEAMSGTEGPRVLEVASRMDESAAAILVSVSDSGPGLDPATVPNLFEPFYTTKATGMGMGLAISRSIVEAHGGKIRVASNGGHGATFEFAVPVRTSSDSNR